MMMITRGYRVGEDLTERWGLRPRDADTWSEGCGGGEAIRGNLTPLWTEHEADFGNGLWNEEGDEPLQ